MLAIGMFLAKLRFDWLDKQTLYGKHLEKITTTTIKSSNHQSFIITLCEARQFKRGNVFQFGYFIGLFCTCVCYFLSLESGRKYICNLVSLVDFNPFCCQIEKNNPNFQISLVFLVLMFQMSRRLFESLFVHKWSSEKISNISALLLVGFYVAVPISPLLELISKNCLSSNNNNNNELHNFNRLILTFSLILFLFSSWAQHKSHKILASYRKNSDSNSNKFVLPTGFLFDLVDCPHYGMEILIYFCFALIQSFSGLEIYSGWLIFLFVIANLSNTANKTHEWYKTKFRETYPIEKRTALIPKFF